MEAYLENSRVPFREEKKNTSILPEIDEVRKPGPLNRWFSSWKFIKTWWFIKNPDELAFFFGEGEERRVELVAFGKLWRGKQEL